MARVPARSAGVYGSGRVTLAAMRDYLSELFSLPGRVAVVTGGSSGIGRGMASALARAGAQVVLIARDSRRLEESAASLRAQGCSAAWLSADLDHPPAVQPPPP